MTFKIQTFKIPDFFLQLTEVVREKMCISLVFINIRSRKTERRRSPDDAAEMQRKSNATEDRINELNVACGKNVFILALSALSIYARILDRERISL